MSLLGDTKSLTFSLWDVGMALALVLGMMATTHRANTGSTDERLQTMTDRKCAETVQYIVVEMHTGLTVGTYTSKKRARNRRDKLDTQYGAVRYTVKAK